MKIENSKRLVIFIFTVCLIVTAYALGKQQSKAVCFKQPLNQQVSIERLYVISYDSDTDIPRCK